MSEAIAVERPRIENGRGTVHMLLAVLCFSGMNALAKALAEVYPIHQIASARCIFAFLPLLVIVQMSGSLGSLKTQRIAMHGVRAAVSLVALVATFLALSMMKLADATTLFFTFPLFVALLSGRFLRESVDRRHWLAIALGFAGVLVVADPTGDLPFWGSTAALVGALAVALEAIVMRWMSTTESPTVITFYFLLIGSVVTGAYTLYRGLTEPSLQDAGLFLALGLCGGSAQYFLAKAFRFGEAAVIAPLEFISIVVAAAIAFFFFEEAPTLRLGVGAVLIIAAGTHILAVGARRSGASQLP